MKVILLGMCIGFLFFPTQSHGQIRIHEVAWMGSDSDANNEWIELYNTTSESINLSGWTIEGSLSISLSGIVPPFGLALLERTDDDSVPGVTALRIYTGALPNEAGGTLILKNAHGEIFDQVVGGANWSGVGGSNVVPKKTAQRTRTGTWVTAAPTPGLENAQISEITTTATSASTTASAEKSGGGGGPAKRYAAVPKLLKNQSEALTLTIEGPTTILVNEPVSFEVFSQGVGNNFSRSIVYAWNLGDLHEEKGKKVSHTFSAPGTYIVAVEGVLGKKQAIARHEVTVLPVLLSIIRNTKGELIVTNNGVSAINLDGYTISYADGVFTFPKLTFLKEGGTLVIPKTRLQTNETLTLKDGSGAVVAVLKKNEALWNTSPVLPKEVVSTTIVKPSVASPQATVTPSEVIRIGTPSESQKDTQLKSFLRRFFNLLES